MGLTGKRNAFDRIIGNTSLAVLGKADAPVLAIPSTSKFEGIENLVYTTNFEFRDLGAINYLGEWAKVFKAAVHCLHTIEKEENESHVMKNMNILKTTYKGKHWVDFDMEYGKFKEEIEGFAKVKKADIIVMMSHKTNIINRVLVPDSVKDIALTINTPILVIKDNAFEVDNKTWELQGLMEDIG